MVTIEHAAEAALKGDTLLLRSLVQDLLHATSPLSALSRPASADERILSIAAALAELLAERSGQPAPAWAAEVGPVQEPIFLVLAARSMPHLHDLCEAEAPMPLRKRRLYAPPNYLAFA